MRAGIHSITVMENLKTDSEVCLPLLLMATRNYSATDPRGKIFALPGLAQNATAAISTGYASSTEEVFQSLQTYILSTENSLIGLSCAGLNPALLNLQLSSWVPDWSHNTIAEPV